MLWFNPILSWCACCPIRYNYYRQHIEGSTQSCRNANDCGGFLCNMFFPCSPSKYPTVSMWSTLNNDISRKHIYISLKRFIFIIYCNRVDPRYNLKLGASLNVCPSCDYWHSKPIKSNSHWVLEKWFQSNILVTSTSVTEYWEHACQILTVRSRPRGSQVLHWTKNPRTTNEQKT